MEDVVVDTMVYIGLCKGATRAAVVVLLVTLQLERVSIVEAFIVVGEAGLNKWKLW